MVEGGRGKNEKKGKKVSLFFKFLVGDKLSLKPYVKHGKPVSHEYSPKTDGN